MHRFIVLSDRFPVDQFADQSPRKLIISLIFFKEHTVELKHLLAVKGTTNAQ